MSIEIGNHTETFTIDGSTPETYLDPDIGPFTKKSIDRLYSQICVCYKDLEVQKENAEEIPYLEKLSKSINRYIDKHFLVGGVPCINVAETANVFGTSIWFVTNHILYRYGLERKEHAYFFIRAGIYKALPSTFMPICRIVPIKMIGALAIENFRIREHELVKK